MSKDKKDYNAKLNNNKDMPKLIELDAEAAQKWGGKKMVVAPPLDYDQIIKEIPKGKLLTTKEIRKIIAHKYQADITCPLTCGIFINLVAFASIERKENPTPFWRVLKVDGELNEKFPGGITLQKEYLEAEGHIICTKGKKKTKYYVKDYEKQLFHFED